MVDPTPDIPVEVVYAAAPRRVWRRELRVRRGTSVGEVLAQSGVLDAFPELRDRVLKLGVFAEAVDDQRLLEAGDRIEIYRPLQADPREVRRQLARLGKTMGKERS